MSINQKHVNYLCIIYMCT